MYNRFIENFRRGFNRLKNNPQLIYTLVVACIIFLAFIFIASRFVSIALDAQDRLVNVRIGSIQDAFSVLASDKINDPLFLEQKINALVAINPTIKTFQVIRIDTAQPTIIASFDPQEINQKSNDLSNNLLFTLAHSDPSRSFTAEDVVSGERAYKTVRFMQTASSTAFASSSQVIILTKESLSAADKSINDSIRTSILIFIGIIVLIMYLFFRHSRIIDYTVLYKKLKEVDTLKDDFISMASHELRTPLTLIRGYAESIREEGNEQTKKYSLIIDDAARQLDGLVADILDVSRIEQGRMNFTLQELDLACTIHKYIDRYISTAADKGLVLSLDLPEGVSVKADETRLGQVLVNLVGNAIKYTKQGNVSVTLSRDQFHAQIRVSDSGIGISAEEQKNLFQKFYRVKNKDTEGISGTGLGLWITAEILRKMNATITVESIQGKGTDFIVTFKSS
jgi:signal transduction histidine kinase